MARRQRIIVVEPDPDLREVLGQIIAGQGYAVDVVTSGDEMRQAFEGRSYDCAFLDLHGYRCSVGRALAEFAHEQGASVIIVIDYATDLKHATERGYITLEKPFRPAEIADAIDLASRLKRPKQSDGEDSPRL
jgi:DNA-binding response OmpR family regulator